MTSKESQTNLAEIMAGIEELLSNNYKLYAATFSQHRDFWEGLAAEELEHADWIRKLYVQSQQGAVSFNENRFDRASLKQLQNRLEGMLAELRAQSPSMHDALRTSMGVESFLLERKFFEVFSTDSPEFKAVLERLAEATQTHRNKIEALLKQLG